jgi:YteA family regulatory protein
MDKDKLHYFKQRLLKEKGKYHNVLDLMRSGDDTEQGTYSPGELSNYDNHPAELGTEVFQATMNNALKVNEEYTIQKINDALQRIDNGTFGKCNICGKDIEIERLEVLPFAQKCLSCEKESELQIYDNNVNDNNYRPIEESVIDAPFGRKYLDKREDDEYEGIDYINDVMKYGSADSPQDMGGYQDFDEYYTNEIDNQGLVDRMDNISNEEYKKQLPD